MVRDAAVRAIQRAAQKKAPPGHSAAFKWLLDRHAEMAEVIDKERPGWDLIRESIHAAGVVGKHGQKLSVASLIQIWKRVCIEAERRATSEPAQSKRKPPNRSPSAMASPPPDRTVTASQAEKDGDPRSVFAPNAPKLATTASGRPTPEQAMERLRQQLEHDLT